MNDGGTIQHRRSCVSPIAMTAGGRSRCDDRHAIELDFRAQAAGRAHLGAAADESAGAEILEAGRDAVARAARRKPRYDARMITFLRNGSGTCTAPLLASASASSSVSDENDAPPKPLRSVALPTSTMS